MSILSKIKDRFFGKIPKNNHEACVSLSLQKTIRGEALVSYIIDPFLPKKNKGDNNIHSNRRECKTIIDTFLDLGYRVDLINWDNNNFTPQKKYDVIFDINNNLQRIVKLVKNKPLKILHLTGSYPYYQNRAERKRIKNLNDKGKKLSPKRIVPYSEEVEESIKIADFCTLVGNQNTLSTYPQKYQKKISLISVTTVDTYIKKQKEYLPSQKEYLWFQGNGAVLRGLDLVLDFFVQNPHLTINIVGNIEQERDFFEAYKDELVSRPNIKYHGFLNPNENKFISVIKNCFCFIAPSCSEGMSSSVATCLKIGLYPILSKNTGITLPQNTGIYLGSIDSTDIKKAAYKAYNMTKDDLEKQIAICQKYALKQFSRENYTKNITQFINKVLNKK